MPQNLIQISLVPPSLIKLRDLPKNFTIFASLLFFFGGGGGGDSPQLVNTGQVYNN